MIEWIHPACESREAFWGKRSHSWEQPHAPWTLPCAGAGAQLRMLCIVGAQWNCRDPLRVFSGRCRAASEAASTTALRCMHRVFTACNTDAAPGVEQRGAKHLCLLWCCLSPGSTLLRLSVCWVLLSTHPLLLKSPAILCFLYFFLEIKTELIIILCSFQVYNMMIQHLNTL